MNKLELEWSFTKDEYSTIMRKAAEIGATHLYAFKDRKDWFDEDGEPERDIYEKLVNGVWFHYVKIGRNDEEPNWEPAFGFTGHDVIPLHHLYKYIGREEEIAVPSADMELKDALLIVLRAGFTVVPPQTEE